MINSEYFPNQNLPPNITAGARPQSAHIPGQQQNNFGPNVPGIPPPLQGSNIGSGSLSRNGRIQLLSAKKVTKEFNPNKPPSRHHFLVLDNGMNPEFANFYRPILRNCEVINDLPQNLNLQQPTTILAPYEIRNRLYQLPQ